MAKRRSSPRQAPRQAAAQAAVQAGWTEAHVRRLFWRAGFGATPKEAHRWAKAGKAATLHWLLDGGSSKLVGPPPRVDGRGLDPVNEWGHDYLWWLDRMVRSQRPLDEKLTLFWHDHFATADQDTPLMLRQNHALRGRALGRFPALLEAVTTDPAMLLFLSLADSDKQAPNENYARELMELFTLGGGYGERDVREAARALTGFRTSWSGSGLRGISYDPARHDAGVKRIFGKRGRFDWRAVIELVTTHPRHPPFLAGKLWSFFVTEPPSRAKLAELGRTYRRGGRRIKPLVAAILADPALYSQLDVPDMVKAPVVYVAGTLRTTGHGVTTDAWTWLSESMGQLPFAPPSVAGWDWGPAWMSSNTVRARFMAGNWFAQLPGIAVPEGAGDPKLAAPRQLELALGATGRPWIAPATRKALTGLSARFFDDLTEEWQQGEAKQTRADHLQRVLRHLLLTGPDAQLH